jgi:hypothetical protein
MSNDIIPNGTITYSMLMGRPLRVRILSSNDSFAGSWMGREYEVIYVDDEKVCLDFGQNWYAVRGMVFTTRKVNIDAATKEILRA